MLHIHTHDVKYLSVSDKGRTLSNQGLHNLVPGNLLHPLASPGSYHPGYHRPEWLRATPSCTARISGQVMSGYSLGLENLFPFPHVENFNLSILEKGTQVLPRPPGRRSLLPVMPECWWLQLRISQGSPEKQHQYEKSICLYLPVICLETFILRNWLMLWGLNLQGRSAGWRSRETWILRLKPEGRIPSSSGDLSLVCTSVFSRRAFHA